MRETKFIEQNREKWKQFERRLAGKSPRNADQLNELFIHITDDLSYSRTFYPNRSVRVYLNGLAQRIFMSIYRHRRSNWGRLANFWVHQLPQLLYEARRDLLLSFVVFALAALIGVVSSAMDARFTEVVLGETYVEMTLANIEANDPMAVYKTMGPLGMTAGITLNNLFVAIYTFVMGVFFSVGSMVFLVRNGVMLGSFQYFFVEQGVFWESFFTIWMHGTLEISAIILAGAAGITMGRGLVFPGTYTRRQAFQRSARRGIKMMIGIVPLFLIAGFIEGYLTRHTEISYWARGLFIFTCLAFVLIYYVFYPYYRRRVINDPNYAEAEPPAEHHTGIQFHLIKSNGLIFTDVLTFIKHHLSKLSLLVGGLAAGSTAVAFLLSDVPAAELYYYPGTPFALLSVLDPLLTGARPAGMWIVHALAFSAIAYLVYSLVDTMLPTSTAHARTAKLLGCLTGGLSLALILKFGDVMTTFLFLLVLNVFLMWSYVMFRERRLFWNGALRTSALLQPGYWAASTLLLLTFLSGLLFASLTDTLLGRFFFELIGWIVNFDQPTMDALSVVIQTFLYVFLLYGVIAMLFIAMALFYHSQLEKHEATHLRQQLDNFGNNRHIRGISRE